MSTTLERIIELYPDPEILVLDGFDEAILGIDATYTRLIYDADKCVKILCEDMGEQEAVEYFEFNVLYAYVGERTPIFIHTY